MGLISKSNEIRWGGLGKAAIWLLLLAILAAVLGGFERLRNLANPILGVSEDKGNFYRFRASFTVKKTGEKLEFDRVVPCHRVFTVYKWGETTVDMKAQPIRAPYPFLDVKVTTDNKAVIVSVPNVCNSFDGPNGLLVKELRNPFFVRATWFENADQLETGRQYVNPKAYESPLAELVFHGAGVEQVRRTDYDAWLERIAHNFKPTKNIIYPFGFAWGQVHIGSNTGHIREDGWTWLPGHCMGLKRQRISSERRRAMLREKWPADRPRFWDPVRLFPEKSPNVPGSSQLMFTGRWLDAVSTRDSVRDAGDPPDRHETFPLARHDLRGPWFIENTDYTRQSYEDYEMRSELDGFLTCVPHLGEHTSYLGVYNMSDFFQRLQARIDGIRVPSFRSDGSLTTLIERDEFVIRQYEIALGGESDSGR